MQPRPSTPGYTFVLFVTICCAALCGCGGSSVILTPDYEHEIFKNTNLQSPNVEVVKVLDRRSVPSNVAGVARVGLLNKEVPYIVQPSVSEFVGTALSSLVARSGSTDHYTPVVVFVDSFVASEEGGFFSDDATVLCSLRFLYPVRADSVGQISAEARPSASNSWDVTGEIEGLMYRGVTECASAFASALAGSGNQKLLIRRNSETEPGSRSAFLTAAGSLPGTSFEPVTLPQVKGQLAPPSNDEPFIAGLGGGFGQPYGELGFRGSLGTDLVMAEVGIGTVPFVWRQSTSVGASLNLLDRYSWIRPKLSALWTNDASDVEVLEPKEEGKIRGTREYEQFSGVALFAGLDIRIVSDDPTTLEFGVGWRQPFAGMDEVRKKAEEFSQQYPAGYDIYLPRWDHLSLYLGVNYTIGRKLVAF